jgi:hypothetical protein
MANRKSTISLLGGAAYSYAYAVSGDLNSTQINSVENNSPCPSWDTNTQFRIDFGNELVAGNASFGDEPPTEYKVYRVDTSDNSSVLAATISVDKRGFTDYAVKSGKSYKYQIAPSDTLKIGSPIETGIVPYQVRSWELLITDDTSETGTYTLSAIYRFEFNPEDVSLQNNTTINKLRGFTPYMKIQRDSVNCWTGTLSSLAGVFDCTTHRYTESVTTLDAIKALSTDTRTKFLRDFDGHLHKIDVSSAIEMSQRIFANGRMTTKKLEWTEIGDSTGVQIIAAEDLNG